MQKKMKKICTIDKFVVILPPNYELYKKKIQKRLFNP